MTPSEQRERWRERQRNKRMADACGFGIVPLRAHLDTLHALLVDANCLNRDADKQPKTLALGLGKYLESHSARDTRDNADMTSTEPHLLWKQGYWSLKGKSK